jgi:hypothetical protein
VHAKVGDRLVVHGTKVGAADVVVEILEVKGKDGGPPYLVKHADGHQTTMVPGPGCVVQPAT